MKKQVRISLPVSQMDELERRATTEQPVSSLIERGAQLFLANFEGRGPLEVFLGSNCPLPSLANGFYSIMVGSNSKKGVSDGKEGNDKSGTD